MTRLLASILAVLVVTMPAGAHFIWILPDGPAAARVVFSDDLSPDASVPIDKIAGLKLMTLDASAKTAPLPWKKAKDFLALELSGEGLLAVGGTCMYGVVQRGDSKPYLLAYHPKLLRGDIKRGPWGKLPLEIIISEAGKVRVQFRGKPLAGAEVVALRPDNRRTKVFTDKKGEARIAMPIGLHGIRTKHIEKKAGERNGKKYEEVRHYATLVFTSGGKTSAAGEANFQP